MKKILTTLSLMTALASPLMQQNIHAATYEPTKSIVGVDERTRVADTTQKPYQSIVSMVQKYGDKSYVCTGTVIAKNKVITAAHCLYDPAKGGAPEKVTMSPGRDADKFPFGKFEATHFYIPQQWIDSQDTNHDIAVIDVNTNQSGNNIGEVVAQQQIEETNDFVGKDVTITGYPGDKMDIYGATQWTHHDIVKSQKGNKFNYDVDTMGGQSGSAVFDTNSQKIIGIHTNGGFENSATQINSEIYAWLQDVLKQQNGENTNAEQPTSEQPTDINGEMN